MSIDIENANNKFKCLNRIPVFYKRIDFNKKILQKHNRNNNMINIDLKKPFIKNQTSKLDCIKLANFNNTSKTSLYTRSKSTFYKTNNEFKNNNDEFNLIKTNKDELSGKINKNLNVNNIYSKLHNTKIKNIKTSKEYNFNYLNNTDLIIKDNYCLNSYANILKKEKKNNNNKIAKYILNKNLIFKSKKLKANDIQLLSTKIVPRNIKQTLSLNKTNIKLNKNNTIKNTYNNKKNIFNKEINSKIKFNYKFKYLGKTKLSDLISMPKNKRIKNYENQITFNFNKTQLDDNIKKNNFYKNMIKFNTLNMQYRKELYIPRSKFHYTIFNRLERINNLKDNCCNFNKALNTKISLNKSCVFKSNLMNFVSNTINKDNKSCKSNKSNKSSYIEDNSKSYSKLKSVNPISKKNLLTNLSAKNSYNKIDITKPIYNKIINNKLNNTVKLNKTKRDFDRNSSTTKICLNNLKKSTCNSINDKGFDNILSKTKILNLEPHKNILKSQTYNICNQNNLSLVDNLIRLNMFDSSKCIYNNRITAKRLQIEKNNIKMLNKKSIHDRINESNISNYRQQNRINSNNKKTLNKSASSKNINLSILTLKTGDILKKDKYLKNLSNYASKSRYNHPNFIFNKLRSSKINSNVNSSNYLKLNKNENNISNIISINELQKIEKCKAKEIYIKSFKQEPKMLNFNINYINNKFKLNLNKKNYIKNKDFLILFKKEKENIVSKLAIIYKRKNNKLYDLIKKENNFFYQIKCILK